MADDDKDQEKPKGSMVTKILLFGVLPLMTAIVLVVGGLFVAGVLPGAGGGHVAVEEGHDGGHDEDDSDSTANLPAVYIPIDPAFVVNFASQGRARFLQITVEVMARDPKVPEYIEQHLPVIRNNLMLLFSSQTYDSVNTLEGKEALREEALSVIQEILQEETGDAGVDAVYFTSFVMQ
ncbi:MAG: flagellar basal body-associated FliL family protein [Gammaproteobacteria bacterium]|nr:flagellar basal body-associated FliL family protein [Gammaproteobacteria bacterium]MCF6363733.1 flagellar basal body-associated FliL family protein [Gammaproteobacteria bacterium]